VATVEPGDDFSDLLPLKAMVGGAHVVALGEPTHGTHEPLAFRNRLIRFLVEQVGFTAVALESGFTESASADAFVGGGPGDAQSVIAAKSVPPYVENAELIQWMRDYNATAAAGHHRIRLYGVDLAFGGRAGGPRRAIDYALAYLSRAGAADADRIRSSLGDSLPASDDRKLGMLSQPALAALEGNIQKIAKAMAQSRRRLITQSSIEEYRWALHNLEVARQLSKCFHVTTPLSFQDMQYAEPVVACRDRSMAENVRWALNNEGPNGRLLVFGHNGHVMNAKNDGRRWAKVRKKPPMMGFHLRRMYGNNLYIIAMTAATTSGGFRAAKPLEEDSIEKTLAGVGLPLMFLDVRMARQSNETLTWLSAQRSVNANVDAHTLITPSTAADAFFFISTLTPAIRSSDKAP
jgi:erythromycin esterase